MSHPLALRARYPDLLIENVSGGGNRLDFGMLAHTDVAWMDDRSAPSAHVRHNLEGLTAAFPPAYLLSFVIDSEAEPIHGSPDLPAIIRSRMPGVFGMTFRAEDLDEELRQQLSIEIARYKQYRDTITGANATLLSGQAPVDDESWDVLQELSDDGRRALIFAFKTTLDEGRIIVHPRSLIPDATYAIYSADLGLLGEGTGEMLMLNGIEIDHGATSASRAHIVTLVVIQD